MVWLLFTCKLCKVTDSTTMENNLEIQRPRKFGPLKDERNVETGAPPLKGIVFDVDGTLWYGIISHNICLGDPTTYLYHQSPTALYVHWNAVSKSSSRWKFVLNPKCIHSSPWSDLKTLPVIQFLHVGLIPDWYRQVRSRDRQVSRYTGAYSCPTNTRGTY